MPMLGASPLGSDSVDLVARQQVVSALEWTTEQEGGRECEGGREIVRERASNGGRELTEF